MTACQDIMPNRRGNGYSVTEWAERYHCSLMRDELCLKIQRLLDRKIRNEMQVVCLLVELRKLMDREQYKDPILRTFSNWVVHTSLDNKADGSNLILQPFDSLLI